MDHRARLTFVFEIYIYVGVCTQGVTGAQKRVLDFLGLELQVIVTSLM